MVKYGMPSILIVGGALAMERSGKSFRGFRLLGDASYAIYLTHFFVTQFVAKVCKVLGAGYNVSAVGLVIAVIGAAILRIIVHLYVEEPSVRVARRYLQDSRSSGVGLTKARVGSDQNA